VFTLSLTTKDISVKKKTTEKRKSSENLAEENAEIHGSLN